MYNSADQGGCYPQRLKAEVDNTLRDLQNSSYPTKPEFNNCSTMYSKYFQTLKREIELFVFLLTTFPQIFSVNGSMICNGLHF